MAPEDQPRPLAALDLGSNSFHLIVGREIDGHFQVVDRHRERVALGAGLDEENNLSAESQTRALASLERFAQRIWDIDPSRLRVVATNTLRIAQNADQFLQLAESALGAPIEVISGPEEARLTWLGVTGALPSTHERRLLIDIGGGSTECVIGDHNGINAAHSLQLGCVSMSQLHFSDGKLSKSRFAKARNAAQSEVQTLGEEFRKLGWAEAYGSSGTINAISKAIHGEVVAPVTRQHLADLEAKVCSFKKSEELVTIGVREDRARVIGGGLAVLQGVFDGLGIEAMQASDAALREGVIQDLIGRLHDHDVREKSILGLLWRFNVDLAQAKRVEAAALGLFDSAQGLEAIENKRSLLRWAAMAHEIGLSLSYSGHHKHSAYLALHSDLDGFSQADQQALAFLLLNQRRRFRSAKDLVFVSLNSKRVNLLRPYAVVLRIAITLMRNRRDETITGVRFGKLTNREANLLLPKGWLEQHPLAAHDLEEEWQELNNAGYKFTIQEQA